MANEFILQALCGSIAGRGWPGDEPVQAGGRLGEWLAGTFAAAVAAAAARHAARGGRGEIVDVSTYEAMVIAMGGLSAMSASVLGADSLISQRSLELPSIVPTADGMVGFCTITAQQFQDFLVMIDRADLVDDADLASFAGRSPAPRRVPRHGHPVDRNPNHAGDRRPRGGLPNPGGPHRHPRHAANHRPLRRTRRVRRIGARGAAASGAVSQRRHGDQAARAALRC